MRVLLDTHTLIWAFDDPTKLSPLATSLILDPANERLVSTATAWELAIKVSLKKLALSLPFRDWLEKALVDLNSSLLSVSVDHLDKVVALPHHHKDPFDRLIVAQALADGLGIVSVDPALDPYGVKRLW